MSAPRIANDAVCVVTDLCMAGTALAETLRQTLRLSTSWVPVEHTPSAPVVVLLALHEPPETIPRVLARLSAQGTRIVFVYDGLKPNEQLIDVASRFRVWSVCDVRDDLRVLADQVAAACAGRVWGQDRFAEQWSRSLMGAQQSLSKREREIAQAYCGPEALTPEEIAHRFELSVHTVRAHLANIRRKLASNYTGNRDALRSTLISRGWID